MSAGTGIQWTDATWNPVVGCTRVSAGCDHCYAVTMTHRLEGMERARRTRNGTQDGRRAKPGEKYVGLTVLNPRGGRHFNGVVRTVEEALAIPLKWRKPRRVFVNSMGDLFHKDVPFEFIDRVFAVMALCPQHTFQVLTKRPERMADYMAGAGLRLPAAITAVMDGLGLRRHSVADMLGPNFTAEGMAWPFTNVWLGTSIEDQATADARIPHLLNCPAAVWFLSVEPMLGPVNLYAGQWKRWVCAGCRFSGTDRDEVGMGRCGRCGHELGDRDDVAVDWVIVGCESLPGSRCGRVEAYYHHALAVIAQCLAAGVPVFHKQMPVAGRVSGDPSRWPEWAKVREMPGSGDQEPGDAAGPALGHGGAAVGGGGRRGGAGDPGGDEAGASRELVPRAARAVGRGHRMARGQLPHV